MVEGAQDRGTLALEVPQRDRAQRRHRIPKQGSEELDVEWIAACVLEDRRDDIVIGSSTASFQRASEGECGLARMQRIQLLGLEHSLRIALGPSEVVGQRRQSTGDEHHWQPLALGAGHTRQE